jgi:hypothetical protein
VIYLALDRFSRDKTIPPPSSREIPSSLGRFGLGKAKRA